MANRNTNRPELELNNNKKVIISERKREELEKELAVLTNNYAIHKEEEKALKKEIAAENAQIKELMVSLGIDTYDTGTFTASYYESVKNAFLEAPLIKWLRGKKLAKGIVKRKEFIDEDALEALVYNGKIAASDLARFQEEKVSYGLRVNKNKK